MSDTSHAANHGDHHADHAAHVAHYKKIYFTLLALLAVSIAGPFVGTAMHMKAITLATAFGIAVVKAFMVAKHFMHINLDKRYITYLFLTALAFMGLFYAGVSPDVMEHHGRNWVNVAANAETVRALKADAEEKAAEEAGEHAE